MSLRSLTPLAVGATPWSLRLPRETGEGPLLSGNERRRVHRRRLPPMPGSLCPPPLRARGRTECRKIPGARALTLGFLYGVRGEAQGAAHEDPDVLRTFFSVCE